MNSDDDIERIPIYTLEINDTLNTKILGSKYGYCYLDSCRISKVRIVGNPGVYTLMFKLLSFGNLLKFNNSMSSFEFEILPCPINNASKYYILQDIENINLKSCYVPICDKSCNKGKCIGNNICNCTDTSLKGRYCNEYPKLKHIFVIDKTFITIALLLILLSFGLMYGMYFKKDNKYIKGGGYDFLFIILTGAILSYFYCILLIESRTEFGCYATLLIKNLLHLNICNNFNKNY
ncbi:hypothetical protein PIROE2DRAFT_14564 [Piromyces sp. E2]|nr:hypothetical protein PIROE2DRAFT_14564 [Piromyces sp. E2]|eukprot:OUM59824.1 hypothetical protein PIROE2DRAFT_14564 [Piromyces sp. E2]